MNIFTKPRGTRDFMPPEMDLRINVMHEIENVFKLFNFKSWDGPAFETLETLQAKAGPSVEHEIYNFQDKGGRNLGLRFELTTSISRIVANYPNLSKPLKTYSIGKVWRYERPQEGRYREFIQADVDIFGSENKACECELLLVAKEVMDLIGFNDYKVYLNNRKILRAQAQLAGISTDKSSDAFRCLDKLKKIGYEGVREEFIQNGLSETNFIRMMELLVMDGTNDSKLARTYSLLEPNQLGMEGIAEIKEILNNLKTTDLKDRIVFDQSLVRGLDYYTGPIFEIEISSGKEVGSISGGGRYDELVEKFGGQPTTAVGISFGIERIIDLVKKDLDKSKRFEVQAPKIQIIYQSDLLSRALELASHLRARKIKTDLDVNSRSFKKQFQLAAQNSADFAVIIGEDELASDTYTLKDLKTNEQINMSFSNLLRKVSKNE